jgi:transaldolase
MILLRNALTTAAGSAEFDPWFVAEIERECESLWPEYDASAHSDGFVCVALPLSLADDREALIEAARQLWLDVGCDNLIVAVPSSSIGDAVLRELVAEGLNVRMLDAAGG